MKCEWKEYKIGDLVEIRRGSSPRPIQKYLSKSGMPWVKIADATSSVSRYIESTNEYIIDEGISKTVIVEPNTLILSNSATPGLPKIMAIKACVHDGWLIFSNYRRITREFLYYKFIDNRRFIINQDNGSVFQNLKTDIVKNFIIKIPELEEQKKIVSILSELDEKIELNNKINQNLQQQAQAIFKSWFVDFEPFGGTMPNDWLYGKLGEYVDIKRGSSPRPIQNYLSEYGYNWLKISDATATKSPFLLDIKERIREEGLSQTTFVKKGSLVVSNSATPGIPKILDIDTCIHDGWLYFRNSLFSNEFLYLLFEQIRPTLVTLGNGSVFTNLKTEILKNYKIVVPSSTVLQKFDCIVKVLFNAIRHNTRQTQKLTQLRDTLLPKLMNGEIDVDKVKIW